MQSASESGGGIRVEGSTSANEGWAYGMLLWGNNKNEYNNMPGGGSQSQFSEYQFLSNSGPIDFVDPDDDSLSRIQLYAHGWLGARKDSAAIHGVTPIAGSSDVITSFRSNYYVDFTSGGLLRGSGTVQITPSASGKIVTIDDYGPDFSVWGLNNVDSSFSQLLIGDDLANGLASNKSQALKTESVLNAGSGILNLSGSVDTNNNGLELKSGSGAGTVSVLNLGTGGLLKEGPGSIELTGTNTYTGPTTINEGILLVSGSLSDGTAVNIGDSGTYEVGADDTVGSIAGGGSINLGSSTLSVGADNSSTEFAGVVSGSGSFIKGGSGT